MDSWDISCPLIMETWAATVGATLSNSRDSRPSTTGRTFLRRAWREGSDIVASPCLDDIENGHEFDVDTLQFRRKPPGRRRGQGRRKTRCGLKLVRFLAISHSAPPEASYDAPASLPTPSPLGMTFFPFSRPHLKHFSLSVGIY